MRRSWLPHPTKPPPADWGAWEIHQADEPRGPGCSRAAEVWANAVAVHGHPQHHEALPYGPWRTRRCPHPQAIAQRSVDPVFAGAHLKRWRRSWKSPRQPRNRLSSGDVQRNLRARLTRGANAVVRATALSSLGATFLPPAQALACRPMPNAGATNVRKTKNAGLAVLERGSRRERMGLRGRSPAQRISLSGRGPRDPTPHGSGFRPPLAPNCTRWPTGGATPTVAVRT